MTTHSPDLDVESAAIEALSSALRLALAPHPPPPRNSPAPWIICAFIVGIAFHAALPVLSAVAKYLR